MIINDLKSNLKLKYDMIIHHIITIILLSIVYFTQYCGQITILILTCEITTAVNFLYIILNKLDVNKYLKLIIYIFYLILFIIFRLFIDCTILYNLLYFIKISVSMYDRLLFCSGFIGIFGLFIINIYWFILSLNKLYLMIYKPNVHIKPDLVL